MMILAESPILKSRAKRGHEKFWQARVLQQGAAFFIQKVWWSEGSARQESVPERIEGVNKGKANATTAREQAYAEFERAVQKRRDKGFSEDGSSSHVPVKPMLAHRYDQHSQKVRWPAYVQPKLDGYRMLMDGDNAWTRGGKPHVAACVAHLMFDTGEHILDGELLLPGNVRLQKTSSAAKKYHKGVSEKLLYMVYDVVEPTMSYPERYLLLLKLLKNAPPNVQALPTVTINSHAEYVAAHRGFVDNMGYEGSILRVPSGKYEIGHRSYNLLKWKDFDDAEFEVVDVRHGQGSHEDKAILVFRTKEGKEFKANPMGTHAEKAALWTNRKKVIGQVWTVRFQNYSDEGIPTGNTVAVGPREDGE